jgi:hypothetical protein
LHWCCCLVVCQQGQSTEHQHLHEQQPKGSSGQMTRRLVAVCGSVCYRSLDCNLLEAFAAAP